MSTLACVVCGAEIQPKRHSSHQLYCGLRCKRRAEQRRRRRPRKPDVERQCRCCNAVLPPRHPHGGGPRWYCTTKCRNASRRRKLPAKSRHCECCNVPIEGLATKRFCSSRCMKRSHSGDPQLPHCVQCRKLLPPRRRKYCDNQCRRLARQGKFVPSPQELLVMRVGWPGARRAA